MKKVFVLVLTALFVAQCGKAPTGLSRQGNAEIQVWARVANQTGGLAKASKIEATTWDSLVVRISSSDMDTILKAFKFKGGDSLINCTMSDVPAGKARLIEVWTKNIGNLVIHSSSSKKVDITAGEVASVVFSLTPKRGSIYIEYHRHSHYHRPRVRFFCLRHFGNT